MENEKWPDYLPEAPRVGDIIRSRQKWRDSTQIELQVVRCTWKYAEPVGIDKTNYGKPGGEWYLEVELHLVPTRFENITTFEKWYEKIRR